MSQYTDRLRAASALLFVPVVLSFAACGGNDSANAREVPLATTTPATQAPINDVPRPVTATTPPAASTPAVNKPKPTPTATGTTTTPIVTPPVVVPPAVTPPPAAPTATHGVIPAGADFAVRSSSKICTNTHHVGDRIEAVVAEPVTGSDGAVIPAGASAMLEVTQSQYGKNDANAIKLDFRLASLSFGGHNYDVVGGDVISPPVTKDRRQSTGDQAKKVAAGAAIGAIIGKVAGKSGKATAGGAAVGALGGVAVAAGTADYDGCVAADARLPVRLSQSLRVRIGA